MVAKQGPLASRCDEFNAFNWIRSIAEDVTQTDHTINIAGVDIGQDRCQRLEVAMDVTDDGGAHGALLEAVGD